MFEEQIVSCQSKYLWQIYNAYDYCNELKSHYILPE